MWAVGAGGRVGDSRNCFLRFFWFPPLAQVSSRGCVQNTLTSSPRICSRGIQPSMFMRSSQCAMMSIESTGSQRATSSWWKPWQAGAHARQGQLTGRVVHRAGPALPRPHLVPEEAAREEGPRRDRGEQRRRKVPLRRLAGRVLGAAHPNARQYTQTMHAPSPHGERVIPQKSAIIAKGSSYRECP